MNHTGRQQEPANPAPSPYGDTPAEAERDRALVDADRLLMQIVQTSVSLIGFGFTIHAFFNGVADSGLDVDADQTARRLGLALLTIGLVFLTMGVWNQAKLRWNIRARYQRSLPPGTPVGPRGYSAAPSFVLAAMLLVVGLAAFVSIVLRMVA